MLSSRLTLGRPFSPCPQSPQRQRLFRESALRLGNLPALALQSQERLHALEQKRCKARACTGGRSLRHREPAWSHRGSQGSPSLASGQGCLQTLPEPRQVLAGQSPSFPKETDPCFPGGTDEVGQWNPQAAGSPHPATQGVLENPKSVSGDGFLHHLPL